MREVDDLSCLASTSPSTRRLRGPAAVATATAVRARNGKTSITDGPFAEIKECLAGFCMVEVRDLNEAIQIASRIPPAQIGSIEVRPLRSIREHPNTHRKAAQAL